MPSPPESADYKHFIDTSKGIGILLVVFGHGPFPDHFIINCFHMPLFFFIAGLTFQLKENPSMFIMNKVQRIGYPYVFYSLTFGIISTILGFSRGPLWFFETIFLTLCLYMLIKTYFEHILCHLIVLTVTVAGVYITNNGETDILPFNMNRAMVALLFVHLGCLSSRIFFSARIWIICFMLLIGGVMYISGILLYRNIASPLSDFVSGSIYTTDYVLFLLTSVGGCLATVSACRMIDNLKLINWFGKNSMTIMGTHWPLILILNILVSKISFSVSFPGKLAIVIAEYSFVIAFCSLCCILFKKYLPVVTGYKK